MILKRLLAKHFRLLEDAQVDFLNDATVLIGPNNSGKSNVLDAILLIKDAIGVPFPQAMATRGGFARIVSRQDTRRSIELTMTLDNDGTPVESTVVVNPAGLVTERYVEGGELWTASLTGSGFQVRQPNGAGGAIGLGPNDMSIGRGWQQEALPFTSYMRRIIHIDPFRRVDAQVGIAEQERVHPTGTDLPRVLHYHYNNERDRFDQYEELVRQVIPEIRIIETPIVGGGETTVQVRFHGEQLGYHLQQLSSGIKDVLILIGAVHFAPPGTLIILEEPENHLHPAAQKALTGVFRHVVALEGKQLILTTHSEVVASQFDPDSVLFVDKSATGSRVLSLPSVDIYTVSEQLGIERGQFMQLLGRTEQVVVILEGREDYEALEPLWRFHGIADKVLPARAQGGGWAEIVDSAVSLRGALERFRLPSRVFVLLDNDRQRDQKLAYLRAHGFTEDNSHVWTEEEVESYLLSPTALSIVSARSLDDVQHVIETTPGSGKHKFEGVLRALNVTRLPKNILVNHTLLQAPGELPRELSEVPLKVQRLLHVRPAK